MIYNSRNRDKNVTCNRNHNRNRYFKGTVIMIILNRNHDFFEYISQLIIDHLKRLL